MGASSSIQISPAESTVIAEAQSIMAYVAGRDAGIIDNAFSGMGTNEKLLNSIICARSKKQLREVDTAYRHLKNNGKGLQDAIKNECGGHHGEFLATVSRPRGDYLNQLIHKACDGIGCNKELVNKIFCFSSTQDISGLKACYEAQSDKQLSDLLRKELNDEHKEVVMHLLLNGRDCNPIVDEVRAADQVGRLLAVLKEETGMMGGLSGDGKVKFAKILCECSPEQSVAVQTAWDREYAKASLVETIKSKMSGDLEQACLWLLRNPIDEFCNDVKRAVDGFGTDNAGLIITLGGLEKSVALRVASRFLEKFNTDLVECLRGELSGDFGDAVVAWVSVPDPSGGLEFALSQLRPGQPQFVTTAMQAIRNVEMSGAAEGYIKQSDLNAIVQQHQMGGPAVQPSYPPQQQPGYHPQMQPGYHPQQQPSYPPQMQPGYPPEQQPGYPPQQQPGYPPQQQPGYPQQQSSYPPQMQPGYPPQQQPVYPPQQQPGYPPQQQPGYPQQQPGYPPQQQPGYPPQQQPGYPPQQQLGYPPQQQPGYPPQQQPGYPPQQQPGYPPQQQPVYPPQQQPGYPPQQQPGCPPQQQQPVGMPFHAVSGGGVNTSVAYGPASRSHGGRCGGYQSSSSDFSSSDSSDDEDRRRRKREQRERRKFRVQMDDNELSSEQRERRERRKRERQEKKERRKEKKRERKERKKNKKNK